MYHVPLAIQCIYGCSNEGGHNGHKKDGNEISSKWERVKIAWALVCRRPGFVW